MFADWGHNNNKFYIIQGLKSGSNYYIWFDIQISSYKLKIIYIFNESKIYRIYNNIIIIRCQAHNWLPFFSTEAFFFPFDINTLAEALLILAEVGDFQNWSPI